MRDQGIFIPGGFVARVGADEYGGMDRLRSMTVRTAKAGYLLVSTYSSSPSAPLLSGVLVFESAEELTAYLLADDRRNPEAVRRLLMRAAMADQNFRFLREDCVSSHEQTPGDLQTA